MKPDPFLVGSRFVEVAGGIDEPGRAVVLGSATDFFRAGGVLNWREWSDMSVETRALFVMAKGAVEAERIAALAVVLDVSRSDDPLEDDDAVAVVLNGVPRGG